MHTIYSRGSMVTLNQLDFHVMRIYVNCDMGGNTTAILTPLCLPPLHVLVVSASNVVVLDGLHQSDSHLTVVTGTVHAVTLRVRLAGHLP